MGFFSKVIEHHRNYPFRPPKPERQRAGASDWPLYWRFIRDYAWPKRWSLMICVAMVAINSTSVYLMSFYSRIVVDNILVIKTANTNQATGEKRIWEPDRNKFTVQRPAVGMGKKMDRGIIASRRPPGAGRRLFNIALAYMLTQITLNYLARFSTRQQIIVSQGITEKLREDMHRKVLDLSMSYHQTMSPGRLLSRISPMWTPSAAR